MLILFFRLQCLFLVILFALSSEEVINCSQPIKIYKDNECIYRYQNFESHAQVYRNVHDLSENFIQEHAGIQSRKTSINLVAYPNLVTGSPRYRADLCIELPKNELADVDSVFVIVSTRNGNESEFIPKSAVVHRHIKLYDNIVEEYVRLGCYWHYILFVATCEITVTLEVILLRKNESSSYGKYYFRIPDGEELNNEKDADPCLFAPFVYAEKNEDFEVVSIISVNCTKASLVKVEERNEFSGELVKTEVVHMEGGGRKNITLKSTKTLHYYIAFFTKMETLQRRDGELPSISIVLIFVLVPVVCIIVLALWCLKESVFASRNTLLFLRERPRVQFLYPNDSKYAVYRKMAETLILFIEKHCNIIVVNDSTDFHVTSNSSPLLRKIDIIAVIPFPSSEDNYPKQCEVTKKDCIIIELPFCKEPFEPTESYTNRKRFRLMSEFLEMVRYMHGCRSWYARRFVCPMSVDEMQKLLEESNLTDDGFSFCLREIFGNADSSDFSVPADDFPDLQEMKL